MEIEQRLKRMANRNGRPLRSAIVGLETSSIRLLWLLVVLMCFTVPSAIHGQPTIFTSDSISDSVYADLSTIRLPDWDAMKAEYLAGSTRDDALYGETILNPKIHVEVVNKTHHTLYYVRAQAIVQNSQESILDQRGYGDFAYGTAAVEDEYGGQTAWIAPGGRGLSKINCRFFDMYVFDQAHKIHFAITYDTVQPVLQGDIDRDGDVDLTDFFLLADNFGKTAQSAD